MCLKGIPNDNFVTDDKLVTSDLFNFKDNDDRGDNWKESSINWVDDVHAYSNLLNQTKDGDLQFKIGVAEISKSELNRIKKIASLFKKFSYERNEIKDNKYHGNILLHKDMGKPTDRMIRAQLALNATIKYKENYSA